MSSSNTLFISSTQISSMYGLLLNKSAAEIEAFNTQPFFLSE
jgi:hypothetical protein